MHSARFVLRALTALLMSIAVAWGPAAFSGAGTAVGKAPGVSLNPGQGPPGTYVKAHYPSCTEPSPDPDSSTDETVSYQITAIAWNRQYGDALIHGDGFTVPADARPGTYPVEVYCSNSDREGTTFTVTEPHGARQDLLLKPDRGPSGTSVTVTGIGFNCSAVRVSWDDGSSLAPGLAPDGEGNISGTFAVPEGSSATEHTVEAVCTDYPTYQATASFTVTEEETTGTTGTTTDGQDDGGTTGDTDGTTGGGTTGDTDGTTDGNTTGDTTGDTTGGGTTGDTGDTTGGVGSDGGSDSGGVGGTDGGDTAVPVGWVVGPSAFAALLLLALLFSLLNHRHRGVRWVHDHLRTALRSDSGAGTAVLRRRRDGGSPDRTVRLEPHSDPGDQRLD
ncbi:hypothetical protein [Streptomyces ossamyceticus]|uniref:hypothetical protein n=1 Tax=Streptomyces ossamyceticus TaxID=249581 RepID=UPI003EBB1E91